MSLIKLVDICKTYAVGNGLLFALNHVNLNIEKGEMVALMGRSGAGKSTAADIIGLLDNPTSGQYFLEGEDVSHLTSDQQAGIRNRKIGFVFQSFFLLSRLQAWENIALPLLYRGFDRKSIMRKVDEILAYLGISELRNKKPNQMSGGQQQRIAIARALVGNPAMIIADEPTGALDLTTTKKIIQIFEEMYREKKITVIIITHDPTVAAQCKRILVMLDGKIEIDQANPNPGHESVTMVSNLLVNTIEHDINVTTSQEKR